MSGGGGASGTISLPAHVEGIHEEWFGYTTSAKAMPVDLTDIMNLSLGPGGNPYVEFGYTDPTSIFDRADGRYQDYNTLVEDIDEESDWGRYVAAAVAKADQDGVLGQVDVGPLVTATLSSAGSAIQTALDSLVSEANEIAIYKLMQSYERTIAYQRARSLRQFSGNMADINAVNSSAFLFGSAIIEAQHQADVSRFASEQTVKLSDDKFRAFLDLYRAELGARIQAELANSTVRNQFVDRAVATLTQHLSQKLSQHQTSAQLQIELSRMQYVSTQEYERNDLDLTDKFARWDFEVFMMASNVLAAPTGAAGFIPRGNSTASSAIGGALSGAAMGAMAGTALGPGGAVIGAAAGGLIGGIGGLLN